MLVKSCLEGPRGITLESWTTGSAWYDPLHSGFLREIICLHQVLQQQPWSARKSSHTEPSARLSHQFSYPCQELLSYAWNSQVAAVFLEHLQRREQTENKKHWQSMSQAQSVWLRMLINLSLSDTLGYHPHLLLQRLRPAGTFDWICGADRPHGLHCKGSIIMRGGMLYTGRDGEFRPVNPLQLLNQMLRNLGLGRSKRRLGGGGAGRVGGERGV